MTIAAPKPFALEHELAKLDPAERGAAAAFLAAHPARRRSAARDRDPGLQRGADRRRRHRRDPERGRRAAGRDDRGRRRRQGRDRAERDGRGRRARLRCPGQRGQGAALRLGYWLARARGAQIIATIDADGQYEPVEIARVIEPILERQGGLRVRLAALGDRADDRQGSSPRRARVRHADQRARPSPDHRSRVRAAGDALRGDGGGDARAAAVSGFGVDDQRRAARLPPRQRCRRRCATVARTPRSTKKGGNFGYGVRFARAAVHTWRRDRKAARTRL